MILAFDIGTTAVKASLFGDDLAMLRGAIIEYQLATGPGSRVELEAETYWRGMKACVRRVLDEVPEAAAGIRGIAITTQGETLIPVDKAGRALRNAIVWLDGRAAREGERIRAVFGEREFYARTGIPDCNGLCPVSKLLWIRDNEPAIYGKAHKFLLLEDYVIMRLTGRFVTEKSLMSTTGYFDIVEDGPWAEMLERIGVDREKIPEALECGTIVGPVLPEIAEELGLHGAVAVVTGAMDQTAGAVGAANLAPGLASETTGTALSVAMTCDSPDFAHSTRLTLYRHAARGRYLYIPICMTAGMVLKWFKDEFCRDLSREAEASGGSVYDLIGRLVGSTNPGANGLLLVPYFAGVTQPDNNPAAKGVFLGLGLDTKREHLLRAIFESVAFMLRENLELVESITSSRMGEIRSLGGGSKSPVWSQIKADVTGRTIRTMAESECASLGAAILAAVALGFFGSAEEAAAVSNKVTGSYEPDGTRAHSYDAAFAKYQLLYSRVKDLF